MTSKTRIEQPIETLRIQDLLTSALEGGSNYWYQIKSEVMPKNFDNTNLHDRKFTHISYPMNEGGKLVIEDIEEGEGKTYELTLEGIRKGLAVMAVKYPTHFADFISENDDSTTGDVFLQCCLFGDAIYG